VDLTIFGLKRNLKIKKKQQEKTTNQPDFSACLKTTRIFSQFFQEDNKKQQEYAPTTTTTQHYDGPHSERPPFFCYDYFSYLGLSAKKMQFYRLIKRGFYEPSNYCLILFHCIYLL